MTTTTKPCPDCGTTRGVALLTVNETWTRLAFDVTDKGDIVVNYEIDDTVMGRKRHWFECVRCARRMTLNEMREMGLPIADDWSEL